jgi:RNA-directed DNA polymerase
VRRVYIPKTNGKEADFGDDSYGFRPKRSAHQALEAIDEALKDGMIWVLDADIEAYFDMIPHDCLMKTLAERIVDGAMLALLKSFLTAPIIDERDGGGQRRNDRGTRQGGTWLTGTSVGKRRKASFADDSSATRTTWSY